MKDLERYSRQILFKPIGLDGQRKLSRKKAVIVGMGALGSVIASHLVRSGVGYVRMIDRDIVELSNLQRQSLYDEEDAAAHLPKVVAAERKLQKVNSTVTVEPIVSDLDPDNAEELLRGFDVIMDGTDHFLTRYLMNDVSIKLGIPWIYGAVVSSRGAFAVIIPGKTPCFRCLFPEISNVPMETADTTGILSPIPHIIGSYQAAEALKLLSGAENSPYLEQIDVWHHSSLQMDISNGRNPDCPTCGRQQYEFLDRSSGNPDFTVCLKD